jgi:hypothetical protein
MSAIILMVRCHSNERLVSHLHMGLGQMAKRVPGDEGLWCQAGTNDSCDTFEPRHS